MKITAEPRSDQWNSEDFIGGSRTFTVAGVKAGTAEQKYDIDLAEGGGRVWRPPLTMLRLLISAWGDEATEWVGRKVTLYLDPTVRFGRDEVGGIRISHLSHLPGGKPLSVMLTSTRGRKTKHTVEPLPDGPPAITDEKAAEFEMRIAEAATIPDLEAVAADLRAWDLGAHAERLKAAGRDRRKALTATEPGA